MEAFPVLDIHTGNVRDVWPSLKLGIMTADFIALDLELSGLGDRKKLCSKCLEERYAGVCDAANTRSIISLGLSLFRSSGQQDEAVGQSAYTVQTYNILSLCSQSYTVEPEALKFLRRHGFDFNKQCSAGLSYTKGSPHEEVEKDISLNHIFHLLVFSHKPLVLHNGLVDLVFLYRNLHLKLPLKLSTFLADVEDMFPLGVFDTKYIAEYHVRSRASYLQYIFRTCWEWNSEQSESINFSFLPPPSSDDVYMFTLTTHTASTLPVCKQYAAHGWCPQADGCTESHDLTNILHSEKLKSVVLKNRKRRLKARERRKQSKVIKSSPEVSVEDIVNPFSHRDSMSAEGHTESETSTGVASHDLTTVTDGHRAGVDAFMTGVCYCIMGAQLSNRKLSLQDMRNKVYLSGKTLPLHVTKGNFGKMSNLHMEKMKLLKLKAIL